MPASSGEARFDATAAGVDGSCQWIHTSDCIVADPPLDHTWAAMHAYGFSSSDLEVVSSVDMLTVAMPLDQTVLGSAVPTSSMAQGVPGCSADPVMAHLLTCSTSP